MGKKGNSLIEIIVVIVILSIGIIGTYSILNSSQILSTTTENKIKAINIAREGIEAVTNIRDTNWIKFSSDYSSCWFTGGYQFAPCAKYDDGSYYLNQSGSLWYLIPETTDFTVYFDSNGLITQTGSIATICSSSYNANCKSIYTREIKIFSTTDKIKVNSIVKWSDSAKTDGVHIINLETTLTNWKTRF